MPGNKKVGQVVDASLNGHGEEAYKLADDQTKKNVKDVAKQGEKVIVKFDKVEQAALEQNKNKNAPKEQAPKNTGTVRKP